MNQTTCLQKKFDFQKSVITNLLVRKGKFLDLSIIIVNWNTGRLLTNCLNSIKNSCRGVKNEIFVVDNDSSDGSREMVSKAFPEIHLINSGSNMGFAKANNIAIPFTTAPYILFLNPDTLIQNTSLNAMCNFLDTHPKVAAISCKITDETGAVAELPIQSEATPIKRFLLQLFSAQASFNLVKKYFASQDPYQSGYVRYLYGPCLMVRKKVLDEVGYFDERFFMYAEDIDLCHRIYQKGWSLYYLSDASIIHLGGKASENAPSDFSVVTMCESIAMLMAKNYGSKGKISYRLAVFLSACIRMAVIPCIICLSNWAGKNSLEKSKLSWKKQLILFKWSLRLNK